MRFQYRDNDIPRLCVMLHLSYYFHIERKKKPQAWKWHHLCAAPVLRRLLPSASLHEQRLGVRADYTNGPECATKIHGQARSRVLE